jgi:glycosyltransferase involved in cell wall biosynthesis
MRVFLLYEGRRRDNTVDGRWNIDESARGPLPRRDTFESAWVQALGREFYTLILKEWVRAGFIEEAVIAFIPSRDSASPRHAPFGVFDLGGGVRACAIPSAAALNDTFAPGAEDLLWVRGPYAYWDKVRQSRPWRWTVYYSANGKALAPGYPVDAVLVNDPEMAPSGLPAVLFDKTCDTSVFRPLGLEKRFDVLVPGAVSGKKGQLAVAKLLPKHLSVVFAGDTRDLKTGLERPEVAQIRSLLPRARFTGHVDHQTLNTLYNEARVVVLFSSADDPAPRVVFEALAVGTPLVLPRDMRYCRRSIQVGPVFRARRWGPLFRRALEAALSHPGDGGAAFAERFSAGEVAEGLWLALMPRLRAPARLAREEGRVRLEAPEGALECEVRDDLDAVDSTLRAINALTLRDGAPIHSAGLVGGRPSWSWHQYELWWNWLRPWAAHRRLLEALRKRGGQVRLDPSTEYLRPLLAAHGIAASPARAGWRGPVIGYLWKAACESAAALSRAAFILRARLRSDIVLVATRDQWDPASGCDPRFAAVYSALRELGLPFSEAFPARAGRSMMAKLLGRRRPALYMLFDGPSASRDEQAGFSCDASSIAGASPLFVRSLLRLVAGRIERSRVRYARARSTLESCRFRLLVALDDPWHGNELLAAAQDAGLRTIGVQHGMFGRYHAGWMNPGIPAEHGLAYERLLVWNAYWKEALARFSTHYAGDRVAVGGRLYPSAAPMPAPAARGAGVLVPYEAMAPHHELAAHLRLLQQQGAEIIFKARADAPLARQLRAYGLDPARTRVVLKLTPAVMRDVRVCVGVYSTVLFDMIRARMPVAVLETSFRYGHLLIDDGLARPFRLGDSLESLLSMEPPRGAAERLAESELALRETLTRFLPEQKVNA